MEKTILLCSDGEWKSREEEEEIGEKSSIGKYLGGLECGFLFLVQRIVFFIVGAIL